MFILQDALSQRLEEASKERKSKVKSVFNANNLSFPQTEIVENEDVFSPEEIRDFMEENNTGIAGGIINAPITSDQPKPQKRIFTKKRIIAAVIAALLIATYLLTRKKQ